VFDFSLGNPDLPPPKSVAGALHAIADQSERPYAFGYMPNSGYPAVREKVAEALAMEHGLEIAPGDVLMTCGAAGGLNALLRAVLEPGEEVVCPAPFFVEYGFYAANHGGVLRPVPAVPPDFRLDLERMAEAVTEKTRVVMINSPNNPTGQIYSEQELRSLAEVLRDRSSGRERPILLVSDEPYRFLTYDGAEVPSILKLYEQSVVVSSYSKSLSLAGERVGYLLVNPGMEGKQELMDGLVLTNRILGFVNAPAIGQQVLERALGSQVDLSIYERRRRLMCSVLEQAGYEFSPPKGGFYIFPKAPGGDDVAFVGRLQEERVLAVPGSGFGFAGHFRLSFCVDDRIIENSAESFSRAVRGQNC
jgi:aspartate aminotransferase